MHLYSALLCIVVHPKRFTITCGGGSLLNHHQCAASTWMMRWLPQDNGRQCAHHTPATGGEERVIETIKCMRIIRRPWLTRTSGGNLARTPGLHPTLYEKCHGIFNDHRESGPRFKVSSERRDSIVSPSLHWGVWTHTDCRVSTPSWSH